MIEVEEDCDVEIDGERFAIWSYKFVGGPAHGTLVTIPVKDVDDPPQWYQVPETLDMLPIFGDDPPDYSTLKVEVHIYKRVRYVEGGRRWWRYELYTPE